MKHTGLSRMKFMRHMKQHPVVYLILILVLAAVLRLRFFTVCDVADRGQVVLGMTNNLPPLLHYVTYPFLKLTDNLWYSPFFANVILSLLSIIILYSLGKLVKDQRLGLLFAFIFAILPTSILKARHISPEELELFFIILISYLFIRLEVFEKRENYFYWLVFYFLSLVVGAFSKQQTLVILVPIFLFGLYKYRMSIFRKEFYYISGLAAIPYISFLLSHPEMLGAVRIYFFVQSTGFRTLLQNLWGLFGIYVLYFLVQSILIIYFFIRFKHIWNRYSKRFVGFTLLLFVFYNIFIMKTDMYDHLLALPCVILVGLVIFESKRSWEVFIWLFLLLSYAIIGFCLLIPGLSIVTTDMCEFDEFGLQPTVLMKFMGKEPPSNRNIYHTNNFFDDILGGEKYILIGGNTGQDIKYNIHSRLYYAGIMNTERFKEINYAIILYPIETTYTGAPAWDYPYLKQLEKNSEVILRKPYASAYEFVLMRIKNHSIDTSQIPDFRERGRKSLKFEEV